MNSSGMKRGLVAIAISAVAVTGIPALAMADTIDTQVSNALSNTDVQLYNETGGGIDLTAKNDGTDTTVRLEAGAGINVAQVTFQVSRNALPFADIATVDRNDDGAFSVEWTPADSGAFPGDLIRIRALNAAVPANDDTSGFFVLRNASANTTQAINIATGDQKGYFVDPDIPADSTLGVTGTTTVTSPSQADAPGVNWMDGNGANQDLTFDASNSGDGTFEGVLRFNGYNFDGPTLPPAEADQMVVRARTDVPVGSDDSDDFEGFTLYEQTLTSLTVTFTPAEEPDPGIVTVTVLDQNGNPIAGIDVYRAGGGFIGDTDGRGQVTNEQDDTVDFYYANADANDAFSLAAGDKRSNDVTVGMVNVDIDTRPSEGVQPVGTAVTETVTVTDQNGDPISNRPVRIRRAGPGSEAETKFATTDSNGVLTYEFTCSVEGVTTIDVGIQGPVPPLADPFTFTTATDTVTCGVKVKQNPNAKLSGKNQGNKDVLKVNAKSVAAGAKVRLQKKTSNGWKQVGKAKRLNSSGYKSFKVKDKNGNKVTKYRAKVSATSDTTFDTSNVVKRK